MRIQNQRDQYAVFVRGAGSDLPVEIDRDRDGHPAPQKIAVMDPQFWKTGNRVAQSYPTNWDGGFYDDDRAREDETAHARWLREHAEALAQEDPINAEFHEWESGHNRTTDLLRELMQRRDPVLASRLGALSDYSSDALLEALESGFPGTENFMKNKFGDLDEDAAKEAIYNYMQGFDPDETGYKHYSDVYGQFWDDNKKSPYQSLIEQAVNNSDGEKKLMKSQQFADWFSSFPDDEQEKVLVMGTNALSSVVDTFVGSDKYPGVDNLIPSNGKTSGEKIKAVMPSFDAKAFDKMNTKQQDSHLTDMFAQLQSQGADISQLLDAVDDLPQGKQKQGIDEHMVRNRLSDMNSPMFPEGQRPQVPYGDGTSGQQYYFSPHEQNPPSTSPARPEIDWGTSNDFEEDEVLPGMPTENRSVRIYRGEPIDLWHPDAAKIRHMLYGDVDDAEIAGQETPFEGMESGTPFGAHAPSSGKGKSEIDLMRRWIDDEYRPGEGIAARLPDSEIQYFLSNDIPVNRGWNAYKDKNNVRATKGSSPFNNPELGPLITEFWEKNRETRDRNNKSEPGGLGRHWTDDTDTASPFAGVNTSARGDRRYLPVKFVADWTGQGENPYRKNVGGDYNFEREINTIPGTNLNIVDLQVQGPDEQWGSAWPEGYSEYRYSARHRRAPELSPEERAAHSQLVQEATEALRAQNQYTDILHAGTGPGGWTPDRAAMHQLLLDRAWRDLGADAIPKNYQSMIVGGYPGAGKSTTLNQVDVPGVGPHTGNYLTADPDYFKKALAEMQMVPEYEGVAPMELAPFFHTESSYLSNQLAQRAMQQGVNIAFDGTLAHGPDDKLELIEHYGYDKPYGVFVNVSPKTSRRRVDNRYWEDQEDYVAGFNNVGGRIVPPDFIQSIVAPDGSSIPAAKFEEAKPLFSGWETTDNDIDGAKEPRRTGASWWVNGVDPAIAQVPRPESLPQLL